MELFGLTAVAALTLTGLVAGGTELVKRAADKDWRAFFTIVVAAIIGGFGGMYLGINFLEGIVFGLAASGYITIAQNIGDN